MITTQACHSKPTSFVITNSYTYPSFAYTKTVFLQDQDPQIADNVPDEDKPRKRVDVQRTIDSLIDCGALPDAEQLSLEGYFIDIEEHLNRYEDYLREWPFLVAQRLLKMQVSRLKNIKHALTEKLNNHPLSTANTAVFGSDQNQGNPPASADTTSQSRGTNGDNSQSANRAGPVKLGLRGGSI